MTFYPVTGHLPTPPRHRRPIQVIGAGGIVRDAHLPAYVLGGYSVAGIFDLDRAKAEKLAADFAIPVVHETLESAIAAATPETIFDVATPAAALSKVLGSLPTGSTVLIQKPFGENLEQARALRTLCEQRTFTAAVNFQLRWAPYITAARERIEAGLIGDLHDVEVRVTVYMPWQLWSFLNELPRVEILYHSIHYIDLVRSFLGEPRGVYAKTVKHPDTRHLASTRTNIALDYGDLLRANITTNHGHRFGPVHEESYVKWEGTRGALKARLGLLMDYPRGRPDALQQCLLDKDGNPGPWEDVPFEGSWYPHAFLGPMSSLQRFVAGETEVLPTAVDDAIRTMAVVEAAYASSAHGATPIPTT